MIFWYNPAILEDICCTQFRHFRTKSMNTTYEFTFEYNILLTTQSEYNTFDFTFQPLVRRQCEHCHIRQQNNLLTSSYQHKSTKWALPNSNATESLWSPYQTCNSNHNSNDLLTSSYQLLNQNDNNNDQNNNEMPLLLKLHVRYLLLTTTSLDSFLKLHVAYSKLSS